MTYIDDIQSTTGSTVSPGICGSGNLLTFIPSNPSKIRRCILKISCFFTQSVICYDSCVRVARSPLLLLEPALWWLARILRLHGVTMSVSLRRHFAYRGQFPESWQYNARIALLRNITLPEGEEWKLILHEWTSMAQSQLCLRTYHHRLLKVVHAQAGIACTANLYRRDIRRDPAYNGDANGSSSGGTFDAAAKEMDTRHAMLRLYRLVTSGVGRLGRYAHVVLFVRSRCEPCLGGRHGSRHQGMQDRVRKEWERWRCRSWIYFGAIADYCGR